MPEPPSSPKYRDLERSPGGLASLSSPPLALSPRQNGHLRIASSYNVRDEPIYDPVALSEPVADDHELEEMDREEEEDSDTEARSSAVASTARKHSFSPVFGHRKQSVVTTAAGRKGSAISVAHSGRRRSTVAVEKPAEIVTWNGVDDPDNPKNWPRKQKWTATVIISLFTFMAPVASSMIAPSLDAMAIELNVTSDFERSMMLSIFILAFAVGPLLFGPMSEVFGRIPVLQATNLFYLIFNLFCGFAQNGKQMLAFRFLSGLGGSAPSAIGGGVLGDCWWPEERGMAIAAYSLAPLIGPAVGPIVGGFVSGSISWRWVFWISSIADAVIQVVGLFMLRETYPPTILHRKVKLMRKETGNQNLRSEYDKPGSTLITRIGENIVRPFRLLGTQPIVQAMAIYMAFVYGLTFFVYATFTTLWTRDYGMSEGISGLHYISLSIGFAIGTQILAPLNDRIYKKLKSTHHDVGQPEFRCPLLVVGTILLAIGMLWYGWSAQAHLHWIMPDIGIVLFAVGCDICFQCMTSYVIDCYTRYAASALAAMIVLRSFAGFVFPIFAPKLYEALDYGWGNSLLALIGVLIGGPAPFLLWRFGPALRKRSPFAAGE